jgi:NTE family protein
MNDQSGHPETAPMIALMLQGGGALGAYQIGAYQALAERALHPHWVAGISIGAFNAAVIAGNPPERRVERLTGLWEAISRPEVGLPGLPLPLQKLHNLVSNSEAVLFGQPKFFKPRSPFQLMMPSLPATQASFYDTSPMLETLREFADFDLINRRPVRLSLGATDILSGEMVFFDNLRRTIRPEHVLASGALPPGFAAVAVDGGLYWDGACVSNTPLDVMADEPGHPRLVVFLVDLWSAAGPPPASLNDVTWRVKQIQYASRTAQHLAAVASRVNLRHAMGLMNQVDDPAPTARQLDIVHIIYHPDADQIANSDAEFSRSSIAERRAAGYRDMTAALAEQPWLRREMPPHLGARVHRVLGGKVETLPEPSLQGAGGPAA